MKAITDELFSGKDLEQIIGSGTKTGFTDILTRTCFCGPFCDFDEDID
jgi:hypothetical protein